MNYGQTDYRTKCIFLQAVWKNQSCLRRHDKDGFCVLLLKAVLFQYVESRDAARGSMGKISKKDWLSPEVFLLNFLVTHGIAQLKDGDACCSLQWITGILSAWSGSALVIPFRWGFRNYLIFDKSGIWSNHHFLWQGNQHVTLDFAVGFSESLKQDSQNTNTWKLTSSWICLFALSSCLVLLFQHFCIHFFYGKNFHNSKKGTKCMWQQW